MAVDEGTRDLLIGALKPEIEKRQAELDKLREDKRLAQIEDLAQQSLSPADNALLNEAGIVDKRDLTIIQARIDRLQLELDAIRNYRAALKAVL